MKMDKKIVTPPKLFVNSPLEPKDDPMEARFEKCFMLVASLTVDKGEKEGNEALAAAVSKNDPKAHDDICIGLIIGILGEPELAVRYFRDLLLVARDGMQTACNHLTAIVLEKFPKMHFVPRQQLLWLTREMIKSSVTGMENICWNLMRQIAGGDVSQPNLWLADQLLDIFIDHRTWLEKFPFLLASVVYTYLRIIEDHICIEKLREKEVKFIVSLMRDRFSDVIVIGRDLLRVLQYVAKIPEIEMLWHDIINNPKSLAPNFSGISQLMNTRTSRRFLQSRITPEMEKKLVFLTSQVRFGTHKRYQDWFQRQYLSTIESQSLRCDLIRFIVGVIHPTNELLGSDIIPRWAIIGWLLTTCTNQVASSNAKLALFYDWLYFNPEKDNIMNIEPAILVMHHSMRPHPAITATLLDFLCRIITNFFPKEREKVHAGITNSLRTILDKRVLPSLLPLFDNNKLDEELKVMLRERFPQFISRENSDSQHISSANAFDELNSAHVEEDDPEAARFSDDEDSAPISRNKGNKNQKSKKKQERGEECTKNENARLGDEELDSECLSIISRLKEETKNNELKCEIMDNLIRHAFDEDYDFQHCNIVASHLADALQNEFEGRIFPQDPSPEAIEDSIGCSVFVAFRSLCECQESDPNRNTIITILAELYALQPRVGYYLLYFLSADKSGGRNAKEKASVYRDLCEAIDEKFSLDICLVNDMRQCQEDDVNLFVYLVPEVFTDFPKHAVGNTDLLYLLVSCVDGQQIQTLVCHIVAKDFILFKKDSFPSILNSSLGWETFEQYALWQFVTAHDLPIDCVVPMLSKLSYSKHSEALTSILLMLKDEKPTAELLKAIMSRPAVPEGDRFISSILVHWIQDYEEKLADLISSHLCKVASVGSGGKRKRNHPSKGSSSGSLAPSAETCLSHLDELRQRCRQYDLFNQHSIQNALQQVRNVCTESQKKKFMDLFALADSDSEPEESTTPKKKSAGSSSSGGPGTNKSTSGSGNTSKSPGKSKASSKNHANTAKKGLSDSSEEASDDSDDNEKTTSTVSSRSSKTSRGGSGVRGKPARKRATNRGVSYKISSDDSSDDESLASKKPPSKKKKLAQSDSD